MQHASTRERQTAAQCHGHGNAHVVGDGASTRLWTDNWSSVGRLDRFAPALFAAIFRAGKKRVLREALQDNLWARDIIGALTNQVVCDYLRV